MADDNHPRQKECKTGKTNKKAPRKGALQEQSIISSIILIKQEPIPEAQQNPILHDNSENDSPIIQLQRQKLIVNMPCACAPIFIS